MTPLLRILYSVNGPGSVAAPCALKGTEKSQSFTAKDPVWRRECYRIEVMCPCIVPFPPFVLHHDYTLTRIDILQMCIYRFLNDSPADGGPDDFGNPEIPSWILISRFPDDVPVRSQKIPSFISSGLRQ